MVLLGGSGTHGDHESFFIMSAYVRRQDISTFLHDAKL